MHITGVLLAGGMGQRMGSIDKGLIALRGKPLVAHVLERLEPQVDKILISANRELDQYRQFGHPVITDMIPGFAGPLAGLHSAMSQANTPLILTVPCDSPLIPVDLASRLLDALQAQNADLAVVRTEHRTQPVFSLCRTALQARLTDYLQAGGRKVEHWHASLRTVEVLFDDESAFININTPEELACLEK